MVKRWLPEGVLYGVLLPLIFTSNSIVRYLDQAWLRKATDIIEGKRGNVN